MGDRALVAREEREELHRHDRPERQRVLDDALVLGRTRADPVEVTKVRIDRLRRVRGEERDETAEALRERRRVLRDLAEADHVLVLQHHSHERVDPFERTRQEHEEPERVAGRRRVDDDEVRALEILEQRHERDDLVDPGRREIEQILEHGPVERDVEATDHGREELVE